MKQIKRQHKPKITFTLTQYQLANCLEIIQALEPSYHPVSLNQMVKLIVNDYIAKMSIMRSFEPPPKVMEEIKQMLINSSQWYKVLNEVNTDDVELSKIMNRKQRKKEQHHEGKQLKPVGPTDEINTTTNEQVTNEQVTKSLKTVVTDFSPPTWDDINNKDINNKET